MSSKQQKGATTLETSYLRLWTQHQRQVFAYIYTLIPNRADAEDLLQDTGVTLWERFDDFEIGTDFVSWAFQVAYWKIRNARRKYAKSPILQDDVLLDALAKEALV